MMLLFETQMALVKLVDNTWSHLSLPLGIFSSSKSSSLFFLLFGFLAPEKLWGLFLFFVDHHFHVAFQKPEPLATTVSPLKQHWFVKYQNQTYINLRLIQSWTSVESELTSLSMDINSLFVFLLHVLAVVEVLWDAFDWDVLTAVSNELFVDLGSSIYWNWLVNSTDFLCVVLVKENKQ